MSETRRTIRKYPNRRLYDVANDGYITLADVKQLVLKNVDFEVVDGATARAEEPALSEAIGTAIRIVAFPLYILTLGLIALVVNGLLFLLVGWISSLLGFGLSVEGFWWGVLAALVMAIFNWIIGLILRPLAGREPVDVHRLVGQRALPRGHPPLEREVLAPAVEPGAVAPGLEDHPTDTPVAPGEQPLDDPRASVVVSEPDRFAVVAVVADLVAQGVQPAVGALVVELGSPLEGRVRLRHEPADGHRAPDVASAGRLPSGLDDVLRELSDL